MYAVTGKMLTVDLDRGLPAVEEVPDKPPAGPRIIRPT